MSEPNISAQPAPPTPADEFVIRLNPRHLRVVLTLAVGLVIGWCAHYMVPGASLPTVGASEPSLDEVKARFQRYNADIRIGQVARSPVPGLFELAFDQPGAVGYVDATGRYVIPGFMVDSERKAIASTMVNLGDIKPGAPVAQQVGGATSATAPSAAMAPGAVMAGPAPTHVPIWELPEAAALAWTHGTGKRKLVVFSDPQCVHCRALDAVLQDPAALPDTTVHIYPLAAISGSTQIAANVLCAADPKLAWRTAIQARPLNDATDRTAAERCLAKVVALDRIATQWGVNSTPTLFAPNGARMTGAAAAPAILGFLDANPRTQ